ncbi:MAG: GLPGLI family protein [Muribaculum sp.]|nr:GLPGLI family protein [Muribaculum sp.]
MKQLFVIILCSLLSISVSAYELCSQLIDKASPIDTAQYKITYTLKYKYHPDYRDYYDDTRIVQIGKRNIKDYSDIIQHFDSLATEQVRRGASSYSNVSGMPWPIEIVRPVRGTSANLRLRLSLNINTLIYTDSIQAIDWKFVPEENMSILGYECSKAIGEFAGRTYTAWFSSELPLPYGPYKFGGLPGLILKIEDIEQQFIWEAIGFERSNEAIMKYQYENANEKTCTAEEAAKTLTRYFKSPVSFEIASFGGDSRRIHIVGKDGKEIDNTEAAKQSIPYKPLEIK